MHKIYMVSDSETIVNILPDVEKRLKEEILDIKCIVDYGASRLDIPLKIQQNVKKADLFFVFVLYPKETPDVSVLLNKLVDLELAIEKPIIKAVKESDLEEIADPNGLEEERQSLVLKWSDYIFRYLKKPESFAPQYFSKPNETESGAYAQFK